MVSYPRIRLSRLRDIGRRCWHPIDRASSDESNAATGGEYDDYLIKVARMIRMNESDEAAAQYLVWAESEDMRMEVCADIRARAAATIAAIRSDHQLWTDGW